MLENITSLFTRDLLNGLIVGFELGFIERTVEGWRDGSYVGLFDGIANSTKMCQEKEKKKLV